MNRPSTKLVNNEAEQQVSSLIFVSNLELLHGYGFFFSASVKEALKEGNAEGVNQPMVKPSASCQAGNFWRYSCKAESDSSVLISVA